jgi:hypothetical protein
MKNNLIYYSIYTLMIASFIVTIIGFQALINKPIFNLVLSYSDSLWLIFAGILSSMALALKATKR